MANNRLFILDTKTGELFYLASSLGYDWALRDIQKALESWIMNRDIECAWGGSGKPSALTLIHENDDHFDVIAERAGRPPGR